MNIRSTVLAGIFVPLLAAAAAAAGMRDGAVISNSGSTNIPGYSIKIWSDGSVSSPQSQTKHIDASLAARFFADAKASKHAGSIGTKGCMKSASFGSVTTVNYHGWTSGDLECPGNPAFSSDVHALAKAVIGAQVPGRRIPRLPNEVRRPESSPVQPTASPDSGKPTP
ncbi:MAG TPA: hypothetical protein VFL13_04200 [Candidatus Baltobacteraceae bacterium]|nr:hypothetical protein [Candidatus Baltobacteraceae bacterium]